MSLRSALRVSLLLGTLGPLACAVETQDFPDADGGGDGGTLSVSGSASGGSPPLTTAGTKSTPQGGNDAFGGTMTTGGSSKGGTSASGGKSNEGGAGTDGGAGKGGSGSAGTASTAGTSSGGSGSGGCTGLRTWTPATSMQIKPDEVIQWMGKRYKATQAVDWTNAECAPDKPADWCKAWFAADGSC